MGRPLGHRRQAEDLLEAAISDANDESHYRGDKNDVGYMLEALVHAVLAVADSVERHAEMTARAVHSAGGGRS